MLGLRNPQQFQAVPNGADAAPWAGQTWHEGGGTGETMHQMRSWRELKLEHLVEDPGFLNVGV